MPKQRINLSMEEVYPKLCPDCQEKVAAVIKRKLAKQAEQAIEKAIEGALKGRRRE